MENNIKVVELFAGVGGFRLGLEGWNNKSASSNYKENFESPYQVVWSNQWEPSTKVQHASMVYETRWDKKSHCNQDISTVEVSQIPDHDLIVGGFPCQDYSVAYLKGAKKEMRKNPQGFAYNYSQGGMIFNFKTSLSSQLCRHNFFFSLKRKFHSSKLRNYIFN